MKKLFTSLIVGVIAITTSIISLLPVHAISNPNPFPDVSTSHSYLEAINYLKNQEIIQGYPDGSFKPNNQINRAEFLKVAMQNLKNLKEGEIKNCDTKNLFPDVPNNEWFSPYICTAKKYGLIKGYADGKFRPEQTISFAEASKILLKTFGHQSEEGTDKWYANYIGSMENLKAIPTTILNPHTALKRGEMASLIWRLKEQKTDRPTKTFIQLEKGLGLVSINSSNLPKVKSCIDLNKKLEKTNQASNVFRGEIMEEAMPMMNKAMDTGSSTKTESTTTSSNDYSKTNIQVKGVDEADIIKNDGEFIYLVKRNEVRIIKAFPVEEMKEVGKITFEDERFNPSQIFLEENKLIVIGRTYIESPFINEKRILLPYERGSSRTKTYIIDIKDKKNPKIVRDIAIEGSLTSSRKIGDYVYLVLNKHQYFYGGPVPMLKRELTETQETATPQKEEVDINKFEEDLNKVELCPVPKIKDSKTGKDQNLVPCGDVRYFPGHSDPNYLIIVAIPVNNLAEEVTKKVYLGGSQNVYMSLNALYVASSKYFFEALIDPITKEVIGENNEGENTVIFKFNIDGKNISYGGKGKVPGHILNQFSMDEFEGNFRIATTKGNLWGEGENMATNNLYILDKDMAPKGKLEGLAKGEKIYSVRFMGKRAYIVTFKNVDPLFVIDLTTPENPTVLGELKIPGYSEYLHPYDENHLIGFGKEAIPADDENRKNFAWYQGIKIAIFDVSDVTNPKQKFVELIGDRGTDSELLRNHKALLFDKEKELLAFPIKVTKVKPEEEGKPSAYGQTIFQGAYIYNLNLKDGFKLKGKVTHHPPETFKEFKYSYGNYGNNINRIIYIGKYLYTISQDIIKGVTMDSIEEKNKVELEGSKNIKDEAIVEPMIEPMF